MIEQETDLSEKKCVPCEGWTLPFKPEKILGFMKLLKTTWDAQENKKISRQFIFNDFKEVMMFVNKVAEIADADDHHPDIHVHYNKVEIELSTHTINGLSVNDFIVARKIEKLLEVS